MKSTRAAFLLMLTTAMAAAAPNVLLICVDDLKPLLGCYGESGIKTPHIDRLAARGLRFDLAYCNQAVCAPSRNALLTGMRPDRAGVYDLSTFFRKAVPDAVTFPQHFKSHGYRSAALGKILHVSHGNSDDPLSWSVPAWRPKTGLYAIPPESGSKPATERADVPDNRYGDGLIADEAVRRIGTAADDKPFLLAVGFLKPHLPFCAPEKYWKLYERESFRPHQLIAPPEGAPAFGATDWGELRQYDGIPRGGPLDETTQVDLIHGYHAAVSYVDAQIGRVLDALDPSGMRNNTIVVLWGDHGFHLGDHGFWCKHTNYEQAARVPLIIAAPGLAPGVIPAPVETVDLYPTLCELAGLPAPAGLDGASLVPILKNPSQPGKGHAFHVYPRGKRIGRAVRTNRHRLVEWKVPGAARESAEIELYDYSADPAETRNLASEQPETVRRLSALIDTLPPAKPQWRPAD